MNNIGKAYKAVVNVRGAGVTGSAVGISHKGKQTCYLSAAHVFFQKGTMSVGKQIIDSIVLSTKDDIAFFCIDGIYDIVKISDNPPEVGDTVFAVGFGNSPSAPYISQGVYSHIDTRNYVTPAYATTASIFFGNSGGALLNEKGELIGITVAVDMREGNPIYFHSLHLLLSTIKIFLKGLM